MSRLRRILVLAMCAGFAGVAAYAILQLPSPAVRLAPQVAARIGESGVSHSVTAVLLNFRGYDTLLEIAVLLLALLGVLSTTAEHRDAPHRVRGTSQPVLQSIARAVAPLMVMAAGYLLWAGSQRPGGAFQAGAVLASGMVLLYLARIEPAWTAPGWRLRAGLAGGFLLFLAVAAAMLPAGDLLQYPPQLAGGLILLIEGGLTLSLGLILAGMFLWLPNEEEEEEEEDKEDNEDREPQW